MSHRQLHRTGLVQNHGPKAACTRRELARMTANVRKVLWRRPGRLVLWLDRDRAQARAAGHGLLGFDRLTAPYSGWSLCLGGRAILCLTGRTPE